MSKDNLEKRVEIFNEIFLLEKAAEIEEYAKHNKGKRHPAIFKDEDGKLIWLSREARRKHLKLRAKAQRKLK